MERRRGGARALAAEVSRIAGPVLGKRGFAEAQLLAQWADIVGSELADKIAPQKLVFARGERREGTLRLRVASGVAPEVQHRAPMILERINAFFGYRAVAKLTLTHGVLPAVIRQSAPLPRPLVPTERAALDQQVEAIEDPTLREALRRLGAAVIGSAKR